MIEMFGNFIWLFVFLSFVFIGVMILSLWRIFEKANIDGYKALIPIYNLYLLVRISELPKFLVIFFLIPFMNLVVFLFVSIRLGETFNKNKVFQVCLGLFPFIYYPILALSNSLYKPENENGIISLKDQNTMMYNQFPDITDEVEEVVTDLILTNDSMAKINKGIEEPEYDDIILDVDHEDETWREQRRKSEIEETRKVVNIEPLENVSNADMNPVQLVPFDHYQVCPNCKTKLSQNAVFCFFCGQKMEK